MIYRVILNQAILANRGAANVGHLEGTSGIAGIIKAILAVEKGIIPSNTNFEKLNPQIDAEFFNLEVRCNYRKSCSKADIYSSLRNQQHGHVGAYEELL